VQDLKLFVNGSLFLKRRDKKHWQMDFKPGTNEEEKNILHPDENLYPVSFLHWDCLKMAV
jgi:hypothetical protein